MISDEELEHLERAHAPGQVTPSCSPQFLRLISAYRELKTENEDWHHHISRMVGHFGREPHPTDYTETIARMSTGLGILRLEHRNAIRENERLRNLCVLLESQMAMVEHFMLLEYKMSADDLETNAMSAAGLEIL
jgi:hypothetical protein